MLMQRRTALIACLALVITGCATGSATAPKTALVAGATGQTGRLIVAGLQEEGYAVRALVRDPAKGRQILGGRVQLVQGDIKDPATLARAMAGASVVVSAVGARGAKGPDRPEAVDYEGVRNLAKAAAAARVQQFVLVSSRGVTQEDNPLNRIFGDVLKWKRKGEDAVRASGVAYTIIRPGGLTNGPGGERRIVFQQGDTVSAQTTIARADVATICVQALKYPEARNRTFETNAVDGSPVSDWRAMFAVLQPDRP
jgi:uncharacterized protein YbjT (DUF2867 family)